MSLSVPLAQLFLHFSEMTAVFQSWVQTRLIIVDAVIQTGDFDEFVVRSPSASRTSE